jgi:phage baseplate assembly protein W
VAGDAHLLRDLRLRELHHELRAVHAVATDRGDLALVDGRANLAQAILIRLLTPVGELAPLGHPEYGCRLGDLVGRPNSETTRNLARLHVLEALQGEPRIAEVREVTVTPRAGERGMLDVSVKVVPVGETAVVTAGPLTLELTP